jgi:adenine-specific DNA methylase
VDKTLLDKSRKILLEANHGRPPRVLDPFAGGGSIPLEALRLGCETYASDYNPVAALMLKCALEFPQKYIQSIHKPTYGLIADKKHNSLLEDVKTWSMWVFEEANREISLFFPEERDGSIPVGFIWARTIPCQNPSCNADIPLIMQFWLSRKNDERVSLCPYVSGNKAAFKIVGLGYERMPENFDPDRGTVSKAVATCLVCKSTVEGKATRELFVKGESGERLIAVVLHKEGRVGKRYRIANDNDMHVFNKAQKYLEEKRKLLVREWGIDPIPDEPTPEGKGRGAERAFSVRNYNMKSWGDLFNARQKLSLVVFVEKIKAAYNLMTTKREDEGHAKVIVTYLALGLDKLVASSNVLCKWKPDTVQAIPALGGSGRQALPIVWDYFELNPVSGVSRSWHNTIDVMLDSFRIIEATTQPAIVGQYSATALPHPDNYFDAVFTDPPYYDNVPYSYLSDFFYVWLKRTIGQLYPELFATPLTPKGEEVVAYSYGKGGFEEGKKFFENTLKKSFIEINRVLRPGGIAVIVYAHKSTSGWETVVNSLLDSGLVVTGAWPIRTEMKARLRAKGSAALGSSIYMIARKLGRERVGFYDEVKDALRKHLDSKLDTLWEGGISGADFFIAAIGSSMEVFGKYEKIIDDEGNTIRADKFLSDIRKIVTDYAVRQVLHNGFAQEITPLTRFYVLWRWAFGEASLEFDDADKLAKGVGIDLPQEWNRGFIEKEKELIRVVGPEGRNTADLGNSNELIDVLHHVLQLWKTGKNEDVVNVLKETSFGRSDVLYRVAQAISESLPNNSNEKKLLEGFEQARDRISEAVSVEVGQTRLFE